jgi:hypothetical protein
VGLKLNGTHQFVTYADDVYLLGDNINTINKNIETSIDASKKDGIEINIEKIRIYWCLVGRMQTKIGK